MTVGDAARAVRYAVPLCQACIGDRVTVSGAHLRVPGTLAIRMSVVAGNMRVHRLIDAAVRPGATVVDVGANIGYNAVYAAVRVGAAGRVVAIEPAADNLAILNENAAANGLHNIVVHGVAAGRSRETRDLFVRGDVSAVNSLFAESIYAEVTDVTRVTVAPLDDLVEGDADLVKIDVEGAELEVLGGMTRLLRRPAIRLIVEWHPVLQQMAGHPADALPRVLLAHGFVVEAAGHLGVTPLDDAAIPPLTEGLLRTMRPVELVARRPPGNGGS